MLKNYLTITLRNIRKRKFFAGINILGMTAGTTACLLIALYIIDEFSYDRFHANADRIYQVGLHNTFGEGDKRSVSVCPPLADAKRAVPGGTALFFDAEVMVPAYSLPIVSRPRTPSIVRMW